LNYYKGRCFIMEKDNNIKGFVKDYDSIKKQLRKVQDEIHRLSGLNDFTDGIQSEIERLETIEVTLNWILRNDDIDLI